MALLVPVGVEGRGAVACCGPYPPRSDQAAQGHRASAGRSWSGNAVSSPKPLAVLARGDDPRATDTGSARRPCAVLQGAILDGLLPEVVRGWRRWTTPQLLIEGILVMGATRDERHPVRDLAAFVLE